MRQRGPIYGRDGSGGESGKVLSTDKLPEEEESTLPNALEPVKAMEFRRLHEYYNHPSEEYGKQMVWQFRGYTQRHRDLACKGKQFLQRLHR